MGSVALRLRVAAGTIAPLGNCTFGNCTFGRALLSSEWLVPPECPEMSTTANPHAELAGLHCGKLASALGPASVSLTLPSPEGRAAWCAG